MTRFIVMIVLAVSVDAFAQSDADRFAEGRIALDKYKDCPAARQALESVSPQGDVAQDPIFAYYMGRTYECLGDYELALGWYQKYSQKVPSTAELLDKIGEVRYKLQKQRTQQAQDAERSRAQAEADAVDRARQIEAAAARAKVEAAQTVRQAAQDAADKASRWLVSNGTLSTSFRVPEEHRVYSYSQRIGSIEGCKMTLERRRSAPANHNFGLNHWYDFVDDYTVTIPLDVVDHAGVRVTTLAYNAAISVVGVPATGRRGLFTTRGETQWNKGKGSSRDSKAWGAAEIFFEDQQSAARAAEIVRSMAERCQKQ